MEVQISNKQCISFNLDPFFYRSEIHAVMTGGFATIAGTVLGAYINFGIDAAKLIAARCGSQYTGINLSLYEV